MLDGNCSESAASLPSAVSNMISMSERPSDSLLICCDFGSLSVLPLSGSFSSTLRGWISSAAEQLYFTLVVSVRIDFESALIRYVC
jgi:hypothetical protein